MVTKFKTDRQRKAAMASIRRVDRGRRAVSLDPAAVAETGPWPEPWLAQATKDMTVKDAKDLLGDRATWELKAMKKALTSMPVLNTPAENLKLQAVKVMLRSRN